MTNPGGVFITQEQIYDEVLGMKDGLSRVEALLEKHVALEGQRNEGVEQRLENHGTRLGDLGTQHATLEGRVTQAEADIRAERERVQTMRDSLEKSDSKRAPWWTIVTTIVAIIAGTGGLITLLITLGNLSQALTHLP